MIDQNIDAVTDALVHIILNCIRRYTVHHRRQGTVNPGIIGCDLDIRTLAGMNKGNINQATGRPVKGIFPFMPLRQKETTLAGLE